jgi:hypothetical protein
VNAVRAPPIIAGLVMLTSTPGNTPPLASRARPVIVPVVVWARAVTAQASAITAIEPRIQVKRIG